MKRVVIEEQWRPGTTEVEYLADIARAVMAPDAKLALYQDREGNLAATLTPIDSVVPSERRGTRPEDFVLVIYSADRGMIVTGYQVSGLGTIRVPPGVRWLK